MGDGILARDNIFQLLRTSLISQSGEEDAEESARVIFAQTIFFSPHETFFKGFN